MILLYVCSDSNIVNNVLFSLETVHRIRVPLLQSVGHKQKNFFSIKLRVMIKERIEK